MRRGPRHREFSHRARDLRLSEEHEPRSLLKAQFKDIRSLVLPPRASATYVLIILGAATGRDSEGIVISSEWRRTQRVWPWKRRLRIRMSVDRIVHFESISFLVQAHGFIVLFLPFGS
jgi:hypothetical protein